MIRWIQNVSKKWVITAIAIIAVITVVGSSFIGWGGFGLQSSQAAQPAAPGGTPPAATTAPGAGGQQRPGSAAARQFPVETQLVTMAEVGGGQVFTGSITPIYTTNISSRVSGRVTELMVKAGDRVKTGQVLARIDTSTLQQQIAQSETALAVSAAQLQRTANDQTNSAITAEKQLNIQRANLDKAITDQQNTITTAKQQLALSQANYNKAISDQQNSISNAKQQVAISQQNLNNVQNTYNTTLTNAQNTLNAQQDTTQTSQVSSNNSLESLQLALQQALVGYNNVQASAGNQTALDAALQKVQTAQMQLEQAKQTTPNSLSSATASLLKAQGDLAAAQSSQTIQIAQETLNRDTIALANAQNTLSVILDTNQQSLQKDQLSYTNTLAAQDTNLNVTKAQVAQSEQALQTALSTDAITISNAQYEQAQANLRILSEQLQDGVLSSPVDGVVTVISVPVGQNAGTQAAILSIAALDPTQATVNISEANIGKIKVGMEMKVTIPTLNKTFNGTVSVIKPLLDPVTKAYSVDIKVDDPNKELLPGMFATSSLKTEGRKAVMVPADAVLSQPSGSAAFVVVDGKAKKVTVKVGSLTSALFEITSGLVEGDELVVKGQELLSDKAAVQIVKPGQDAQKPQGAGQQGAGQGAQRQQQGGQGGAGAQQQGAQPGGTAPSNAPASTPANPAGTAPGQTGRAGGGQ
ncbi:efflux RND transporter periplasmic adaptor subunit [Paenibacillus agricola]|uniref:Efflux RND transporter periplasmic adaptor subunit n=1 Tax=Paenibacillus agricola TaxID=2716264 RepID=A0ABX0J810_9BACL|nr:efflux RND transporter periplasmic adaptor subunit [Paenibacillus agricola]NHN31002.1 efflux RND transporter periplasmic adaptor subunit [Paenibacillus agricola]